MLPQENFVSTPLRNRHRQVGQSPQSRRKFGKSVESTKTAAILPLIESLCTHFGGGNLRRLETAGIQ